jgi:hypothetical protein
MKEFIQNLVKGLGIETAKDLLLYCLPIIVSLVRELPISQIDSFFSEVSPRIWYYAVALLVTANLVLLARSRRMSKAQSHRINLADYEFVEDIGVYKKKKDDGLYYCASCLLSAPAVSSPLKKRKDGWLCNVKTCRTFFPNPSYRKPRPVIPRSNWMHRW